MDNPNSNQSDNNEIQLPPLEMKNLPHSISPKSAKPYNRNKNLPYIEPKTQNNEKVSSDSSTFQYLPTKLNSAKTKSQIILKSSPKTSKTKDLNPTTQNLNSPIENLLFSITNSNQQNENENNNQQLQRNQENSNDNQNLNQISDSNQNDYSIENENLIKNEISNENENSNNQKLIENQITDSISNLISNENEIQITENETLNLIENPNSNSNQTLNENQNTNSNSNLNSQSTDNPNSSEKSTANQNSDENSNVTPNSNENSTANENSNENSNVSPNVNANENSNENSTANENPNKNSNVSPNVNANENSNENSITNENPNAIANQNSGEDLNANSSEKSIANQNSGENSNVTPNSNENSTANENPNENQNSSENRITNSNQHRNSNSNFAMPKNVYKGDQLPPERCQQLINRYKNHGTIPDESERYSLLQYLSDESFNLLISGNLTESEQLFDLKQNLAKSIELDEIEEYRQKKVMNLQDEIESTKDLIYKAKSKWDNKLFQLEKELNEKKDKQIDLHQQELSDFDEYYNDINNFKQYSKPSSQLLQILAKERKFVMIKKFDDANQMKKEAMKLEKKETLAAQQKAETEILMKKEKLLHKQEMESISFDNYSIKVKSTYESYKQDELNILNRRLNFLLKMQKDIQNGDSVSGATSKTILFNEPIVIKSPQTAVSLKKFREKTVSKKLKLDPIEDLDKKCKGRALRSSLGGRTRLVTPITSRPFSQMNSSRNKNLFV